jgi:formylglycine-generating enzyme required for sulfatase activity
VLSITFGDISVMELVLISPGQFVMGSALGLPLELPTRKVTVDHPFLLGKYPVTREQWQAVMGSDPSEFRDETSLPVQNVSWDDAQNFCERLSRTIERVVRLPSEAEWEYACRGGTATEFFFGETDAALAQHAWFDLNSKDRPHPVGLKQANPWGLHDILGNVWEWCADVWHGDYAGASADGTPWRVGVEGQPRRCLRGGSWNYDAFRCRSAYRSREWKHFATNHFGLRVVVAT